MKDEENTGSSLQIDLIKPMQSEKVALKYAHRYFELVVEYVILSAHFSVLATLYYPKIAEKRAEMIKVPGFVQNLFRLVKSKLPAAYPGEKIIIVLKNRTVQRLWLFRNFILFLSL